MALHRYDDFRVEVFYFDSPCSAEYTREIRAVISDSVNRSVVIYLFGEQSCEISSRSDLKRRSPRLFEDGRPNNKKNNRNNNNRITRNDMTSVADRKAESTYRWRWLCTYTPRYPASSPQYTCICRRLKARRRRPPVNRCRVCRRFRSGRRLWPSYRLSSTNTAHEHGEVHRYWHDRIHVTWELYGCRQAHLKQLPAQGCGTAFQLVSGKWTSATNSLSSCSANTNNIICSELRALRSRRNWNCCGLFFVMHMNMKSIVIGMMVEGLFLDLWVSELGLLSQRLGFNFWFWRFINQFTFTYLFTYLLTYF